jgi:hypothetical protein
LDDRSLYPPMRDYVKRQEIVGVVVAFIPSIGWPAIAFQQASRSLLSLLSPSHLARLKVRAWIPRVEKKL